MTENRGIRKRKQPRRLTLERFEDRRLLAGDVLDSSVEMDVNGDGGVSAADALMVINQMNRHRLGESDPGPRVMDVNGDGEITAVDAIRIINRIFLLRLGNGPNRPGPDFRSMDGSGNHLSNPDWGTAGSEFTRLVDSAYSDGIGTPAGSDRPSARLISNLISAQNEAILSDRGLSDMAWQWGQFIDHDIDLTAEGHGEAFNISVPTGDAHFDPAGTGEVEIGLTRSGAADGSGESESRPRAQVNEITSFIDGSMIYGSDEERAEALRSFVGGRLKTSADGLLPMNVEGLPNAGGTGESLFLAGDVRANEQVGLTSMHTLWVREHNRIADALSSTNPFFSDEILYQRARELVIAQIQAITFNEYLPAVLGNGAISPYEGYDSAVNPTISNLFATAAYRYGHTQLPADLMRLNDDGSEIEAGNLPLREAFFNPDPIMNEGIDSILKGLATGVAQEIDVHVIDDVRNFLFGPPGAGGFDLAALNIQRGRDHGLPDFNSCRVQLGLERVESFSEITSNEDLAESLEEAYETVDQVDVWVGALAEDHAGRGSVGEFVSHVIAGQFEALRDGDRFWYQRRFAGHQLDQIEATRLSDVILRNTDLSKIQANVFLAADAGPPLASRHR